MIAVSLRDVSVQYGRLSVLRAVAAEAPVGSIVGLCGPNGTGKTTLLRLILGLQPPGSGEVRVLGRDPYRRRSVRRQIGYLPQVPRHNAHFPIAVRDLVGLGLVRSARPWSRSGPAERRDIDEALAMVQLTELAGRPVRELSGGQMQLALLARAFVGRPRLLLLDEPLAGLDQARQSTFYHNLAGWRAELGATVIAVCHESHGLHSQATLLWRLADGELRAEGSCA